MEQEAFEPIGYAVTHPLPFNNANKANAAATNNREKEEEAHKQENIEQAETNLFGGDEFSAGFMSLHQSACVSLLFAGCAEAFSDFFSLLPEELELIEPPDKTGQSGVLKRLSSACSSAAAAIFRGDLQGALQIYLRTSRFLTENNARESALYIHRKCLELIKQTDASPVVAALLRDIGDAERAAGRWDNAENFYVESLKISRSCNSSEDLREASKRLMESGDKKAASVEHEGQLKEAVDLRRQCLKFAESSCDEQLQWEALHALGLTLKESGVGEEAVAVQKECLRLALAANDRKRQCIARAALAAAYRSLNCNQEAVEELETLLQVATQAGDVPMQSQTCADLSVLYQQQGKEDKAVELCQRHFDFARKSGDAESVEAARASLGLARGVLQLQSLRQLVGGSLQEFASWKCTLNAKTKS